ncbi:MAG: PTS sugar transporter subunit IIA [Nitrospinota bacterium]
MELSNYLSENLILLGIEAKSKTELLEKMVAHIIEKGVVTPDRSDILVEKLLERETLSSTGIGSAIAIPHASGEAIKEEMVVVVGQSAEGLDYGAIDDEPVKLFFMLISSDKSPKAHLQLLAAIVRLCKNRDLIDHLMNATNSKEAYDYIVQAGHVHE